MKLLLSAVLGTLLLSSTSFSMGGDKPGPNGGHITMPGTYHVELTPPKKANDKVKVYLLDMSMKNPITADSSVSMKFMPADKTEIKCNPEKNYFICDSSESDLKAHKKILLMSVRNKVKGKIAEYNLPLSFH